MAGQFSLVQGGNGTVYIKSIPMCLEAKIAPYRMILVVLIGLARKRKFDDEAYGTKEPAADRLSLIASLRSLPRLK